MASVPASIDPGQSQGSPPAGPGVSAAPPGLLRTERPWGWYEELARGELYLVKRLWIHPCCRISLQRHQHRCEHWVVVNGNGRLETDGQPIDAVVGTTLFVARGAMHRATAGSEGLAIIEVQRGSVLEEDDIERFADDFGRVSS